MGLVLTEGQWWENWRIKRRKEVRTRLPNPLVNEKSKNVQKWSIIIISTPGKIGGMKVSPPSLPHCPSNTISKIFKISAQKKSRPYTKND